MLETGPNGSILSFSNEGRIETVSEFQRRTEEYLGGGLSVAVEVSDRLTFSVDASYSDTTRREYLASTRLQSEPTDVFGNVTPAATDRPATSWSFANGSELPAFVAQTSAVTNHDLFADAARTRVDLNQYLDNTIKAIRGDFHYELDGAFLQSIEGGVRYSELEYSDIPRVRSESGLDPDVPEHSDDDLDIANLACRVDFPESNFLSAVTNGQSLVTNVDGSGNVISQVNSYAAFDPICLVESLRGGALTFPGPVDTVGNIDVLESTLAGYVQVNYAGELGSLPVRGNFGVRVINTDVESTGLRTTFTTITRMDGTIAAVEDPDSFYSVVGGSSYTTFLPSINFVADLSENVLLRGGVFRGLSRPDPSSLGFGRDLDVNDDGTAMTIAELVGNATANGNPDLLPLLSWNFDAALEYYPNPDTIFAVGVYYKRFQGGFENTQRVEEFVIDGMPFFADVTTSRTDEDTSEIYGVEVTAAHAFTYLPGLLSGLGTKVSYNFASSNLEFEDENFGASLVLDEDGNVVSERVGIIPPADLFGLSKHVLAAQVYYQIGKLDLQGIYKYRSSYFQQFVSTPGIVRYVGNTNVFEARASYKVTDNITVRLEGINLFDEPKRQYIPTQDNLSELNSYGPRYFASVRFKF